MNDYEKIINCLKREYYYMHARNQYPNRIILGIEIAKILGTYCKDYIVEYKAYDDSIFVMGLPVTIDYKDKWFMMICEGNEFDGKHLLK